MLEKYNLPKTKIERIKKLKDSEKILKDEFIGLDSIISQLITSITPWYVTPEIIKRPVVISLWGMTGTGKSSVVNRLLELLGLGGKSLIFDCGAECSDSSDGISNKISQYLKTSEIDNVDGYSTDLVFVFDEFQYAKTLDEKSGSEIDRPSLRSIWNLLDNGILNLNETDYELTYFSGFIDDIKDFAKEHPYIKLDKGIVQDPNEVRIVLESLGYFYFDRGIPGIMNPKSRYYYEDEDDNLSESKKTKDPYAPLKIIEDKIIRVLIRKSKMLDSSTNILDIITEILSKKTLGELVNYLDERRYMMMAPKIIDCTKSLVFVVGNLDEAFVVSSEISPDMDADIFYDETSKVTISDIKEALKRRFRPEQIARFGNSIIKYPTLKKEHFKKIIENEINRIFSDFLESSGIKITATSDVYDLLYSEGVYPVQGVRPVFTTIGTIFTPLLSNILIYTEQKQISDVEIGVCDAGTGYRFPKKELYLKYSDYTEEHIEISLNLGELRDPSKRATKYSNAVHEVGHAIIMSYLTGELPTSIVAVSTDGGGFCTTYNSEKFSEIDSKRDVEISVMIGLGGYEAEKLIFGDYDDTRILLGSGSDIQTNWDILSDAVYNKGYILPFQFANYETNSGTQIPSGISDVDEILLNIKDEISRIFNNLEEETTSILEDNKELLVNTALYLGKVGSMSGESFLKFIKKYNTGTLTVERLKEAKLENSSDWYENILLKQK